MNITLADLRAANLARQEEWCPDQKPDLSFRGNELAGEIGETIEAAIQVLILSTLAGRASNLIKKLERERDGWIGSRGTKADLAEELGDIVICCDLVGITAGISLQDAVVGKFNATSEKNGLSVKLVPEPASAVDLRDLAVTIVDGIRGYSFDFSSHPAAHLADYDQVEEMLLSAMSAIKG